MNNQLISAFGLFVSSLKYWFQFIENEVFIFKSLCLEKSNHLIGHQLSNLMFGLVFGAQNSLNSSLYHSFKIMGMLHIWSASGFNVTLFSKTISFLFNISSYVSYFFKTILLLLSTLFFWYMSGKGPSMQRAVLMTGLSLLVRRLSFKQLRPLKSLCLVIFLIVLLDLSLVESLSLRFSVAATSGIILLSPVFSGIADYLIAKVGSNNIKQLLDYRFYRRIDTQDNWVLRLLKSLLRYFFHNLALFFSVQIALLPLISSTWGEIGLLSIITNSLLSGFLPILVVLGLLWFSWCVVEIAWEKALSGFLVEFMNFSNFFQVLGLLITLPLNFFLKISTYFTQVDLGSVVIPEFNVAQTGFWYFGWAVVGWWWQKRQTRLKTKLLCVNVFKN